MKKISLFCLLMSSSFLITAQTTALPEKDIIEVTGKAEKEVMPDEIFVKIQIKEKTESREKLSIEQQEEKLKKAVTDAGIDLKNLSVSDMTASYVRIKWNAKDVVTQKEYMLKTATPQQLRALFTELNKIEVKDAYIDHVSHSKIDSLRKAVRIEAIKAAKDKAGYLLNAIGEKVGNCMVVKEESTAFYIDPNAMSNSTSFSYGSYNKLSSYSISPSDDVGFQKISIEYSIYCKFEIKH